MRGVTLVAAVLILGGGAAAVARQDGSHRPDWARNLPAGYLLPGAIDATAVVSPAPKKGDERYQLDRKIFRETRKLRGTPRWALATSDVKLAPTDLMRDFSCAAGKSLTPETAPKLNRLMMRVLVDGQTINEAVKNRYRRLRPFQIDKGEICQPKSELVTSFDYPSGHTVWGWSWAYVLTQLLPERATPILARGRAYGESRMICGAHNASAVDAGARVAAATVAALNGSAAFRADMDAARTELAALPATDARECRAETDLIERPFR